MERFARPLLVVFGPLIPLAGAWAQPGRGDDALKGRAYLLKEGDQLFDGEVVRIDKEEAVLRQIRGDGEEPREVTLSLKSP